ncbi:ComEC/Rec2 family competence protein [Caldicellulosiruptoraceae bacterium PP1]
MKIIKNLILILVLISILFFLASCDLENFDYNLLSSDIRNNTLSFAFLDVGQGDSIIIKTPNNNFILIDSGPRSSLDKFKKYLKLLNIDKFYAVFATHPHEDHIGNMDYVMNNYTIKNFYSSNSYTNTDTFMDMLNSLKRKNLKIKALWAGDKITIDDIEFEILSPSKKYEELNNMSLVIKVSYKGNSVLLMGDAMNEAEKDIIKNGYNLKSDIIKIGHHGSYSSSSFQFLKLVNPKYAIISAAKNNEYGHPHKVTLNKLKKLKIKTYITKDDGTIIANITDKVEITTLNILTRRD